MRWGQRTLQGQEPNYAPEPAPCPSAPLIRAQACDLPSLIFFLARRAGFLATSLEPRPETGGKSLLPQLFLSFRPVVAN